MVKRRKVVQRRPRKSVAPQVQQHSAFVSVLPMKAYCKLIGISIDTARRLENAGRLKVTYLSARRKGVRSDHHLEYLESCRRAGA